MAPPLKIEIFKLAKFYDWNDIDKKGRKREKI
jgi:hypothetical protein